MDWLCSIWDRNSWVICKNELLTVVFMTLLFFLSASVCRSVSSCMYMTIRKNREPWHQHPHTSKCVSLLKLVHMKNSLQPDHLYFFFSPSFESSRERERKMCAHAVWVVSLRTKEKIDSSVWQEMRNCRRQKT